MKRSLELSALVLTAAWLACGPRVSPEEHLARERSFLRLGVDVEEEERAVRHVLAQRDLSVASEVRGPDFIALGAATLDGRLSAIRVISLRGVAVAEDADLDDLFAPGTLRLLDRFPPSLGEYELVAFVRVPRARDLGCASLYRILPDGNAVPAVLDVSVLGPRGCVADLARASAGRLRATLAFPGLFAEQTPSMTVELAFQSVLIGQSAPAVPVAKLAPSGPWLEAERARLEAPLAPDAPFAERHAVGVARAAIALLSGQDTEAQVAAYRACVGRVIPGTHSAALVADALDHIEHGWLDPTEPGEPQHQGAPSEPDPSAGDLVIDPGAASDGGAPPESSSGSPAAPSDEPDDAIVIEPKPAR